TLLKRMFSEMGGEDSRWKGLIFTSTPLVTTIMRFVPALGALMSLGGDVHSQEVDVPFGLTVDLEPADEGAWNVVLDLDLGPRDWVVSSYSTDSMFGKVALRFQEPHALTLLGPMEEIPPSQWEVEPFSQLDIKVIRHDTRMIQTLAIAPGHTEDIHGRVFFVLEPLCTPFETTFTLQRDAQKGWTAVNTGSRDAFPPGHEIKQ
ncbi:hypothetical protein OA144_00005, partial [bacterium]|nr:hypothetical protein [bacterium]